MKKISTKQNIVIYQAKTGAIELRGDFKRETIWATQAEIVHLFGVDQSVISRHIKKIFKDGEIEEKSNMQKMHNANSDSRKQSEEKRANDRFGDAVIEMTTEIANGNELGGGFRGKVV